MTNATIKNEARNELNAQLEAFLAHGKQITKVAPAKAGKKSKGYIAWEKQQKANKPKQPKVFY